MAEKSILTDFQHPLALTSFRNWLALLLQNGGTDRRYLGKVALVTAVSLLSSPLRAYESLRYNAAVRQFTPDKPPIFIIGHWRSGTTHLHNLFCQDPQFGYITTIQALAPETMFVGHELIDRRFGGMKPTRRPMDDMPVSLYTPQEEEMALAAVSRCSLYHQWWFPRHARFYFERYGLQQGLSASEARNWVASYRWLHRKVSLKNNGRQIVFKSPTNTGRIAAVLRAFPGAKFIHIYRNPYDVFASTKHLYRKTLPPIQLQSISEDEIERTVVLFYQLLMRKLLAEQALIPAGDFVEVRFEDLEADPLGQMRRVYQTLDLPGYAEAEPALERYTAGLTTYRKNRYDLDPHTIEQVNQHWRFALEQWGYPLRSR